MTSVLHIASLIVRHRPEAAACLDEALSGMPDVELALRDAHRCVVLCEGEEAALMERIESLRALHGVIGVNLVYHYAADRESLLEE